MAKQDPQFAKLKAGIFSNSALSDAINSTPSETPVPEPKKEEPAVETPLPSPSPKKNVEKKKPKQLSFFMDADLAEKFRKLRNELDVPFKDLYEEAITELLKKYHKL